MREQDWLADRFEENRPHLRAVAYRILGSATEADDAVQEAWLRLSRSDASAVRNLSGWLTTVVGRACLDMLRSRASRRELSIDPGLAEPVATGLSQLDPEQEVLLADSIGLALLVVLETLTPAERVAFVMHDMFDLPFDEIASIVGRSPEAARQLASRARRRVRGAEVPDADATRQREVVRAFLAASRGGDFDALLSLLDPDVEVHADAAAVAVGAASEVRGARAVAGTFAGRARAAQVALIDGQPGLLWAQRGRPRIVFAFTVENGKITKVDLIADSERMARIHLVVLAP